MAKALATLDQSDMRLWEAGYIGSGANCCCSRQFHRQRRPQPASSGPRP